MARTQRTSMLFLCLVFAISSYATLRWNGSVRLLPIALLSALAYLITFLMDEAYVCLENVRDGIYPKQTELMTQAIVFMLVDLLLLAALVWALAQCTWKFRREILYGFGSGPNGKWCARGDGALLRARTHPVLISCAQADRLAQRGCADDSAPARREQNQQGDPHGARCAGAAHRHRLPLLESDDRRQHRRLHHPGRRQGDAGPSIDHAARDADSAAHAAHASAPASSPAAPAVSRASAGTSAVTATAAETSQAAQRRPPASG